MGVLSETSSSLIGLAVDTALLLILRQIWKTTNKEASEIKDAPRLSKNELSSLYQSQEGFLPYVCVEGEVRASAAPLTSLFDPDKQGVVRKILKQEHRSKSIQGVWTTVKQTVVDNVQTVPFLLQSVVGKKPAPEIKVTDPITAAFLDDAMTTTHDKFESWSGSALSTVMHRLTGDTPKGVHETETMLVLGTQLLAIGELVHDKGKIEMRPPRSGSKYILTSLSKSEVIRRLDNRSFWVKILSLGTSVIGVVLICQVLHKIYQHWKSQQDTDTFLADVRRQREAQSSVLRDDSGNCDILSACVICLSNPREIVLLNCGHLCLCAECLTRLPRPLVCPICREAVQRHVTTYSP